MPRVVACGGRQAAFDKFCAALHSSDEGEFIVLLVDSEGPVAENTKSWLHLKIRDGWSRPDDAADENAHLMVECMENWFLADKAGLAEYFGPGFNRNALPARRDIENVAKSEVLDGLKSATRQSRKGEYGKGRHSFDILEQADAAGITAVSPHARRLVDTLRQRGS